MLADMTWTDGSGILYVCELPEISMAMTQQWYNQDMGNVAFESQEELIAFKLGITLDPESDRSTDGAVIKLLSQENSSLNSIEYICNGAFGGLSARHIETVFKNPLLGPYGRAMDAAFRMATNTDGKGPSGLSEVIVMRKSDFLQVNKLVAKAATHMDHSSITTVPDDTTDTLKALIAADEKRKGGPTFETTFAAVVDVAPRIRLGCEKPGAKYTCMYTPEMVPHALPVVKAAHMDSAYAEEPLETFILKEVRYQAATPSSPSGFAAFRDFAARALSDVRKMTPFLPAGAFAAELLNGFAGLTDMLPGGTVPTSAEEFIKSRKAIAVQHDLKMANANEKARMASPRPAVAEGFPAAAPARAAKAKRKCAGARVAVAYDGDSDNDAAVAHLADVLPTQLCLSGVALGARTFYGGERVPRGSCGLPMPRVSGGAPPPRASCGSLMPSMAMPRASMLTPRGSCGAALMPRASGGAPMPLPRASCGAPMPRASCGARMPPVARVAHKPRGSAGPPGPSRGQPGPRVVTVAAARIAAAC